MTIELTDEDRAAIRAATREQDYRLACESAYLAGIRAGLERAAKLVDRRAVIHDEFHAAGKYSFEATDCAVAIRGLAKP